jgi:hypothetical protein
VCYTANLKPLLQSFSSVSVYFTSGCQIYVEIETQKEREKTWLVQHSADRGARFGRMSPSNSVTGMVSIKRAFLSMVITTCIWGCETAFRIDIYP